MEFQKESEKENKILEIRKRKKNYFDKFIIKWKD